MSELRFEDRSLSLFPPTLSELDNYPVQIWQSYLKRSDRELTSWRNTLSADEKKRADRYCFDRDARAFVAGRGQLRSLLGQYLNLEPTQIKFIYSQTGKPQLDPSLNPDRLVFNVSHSGDRILYAISRDRLLGVDLESIRPLPKLQQLAERFFTPHEATALQALPPQQQQLAFFRGWTRKEAFLKATGVGIAQLQALTVSLSPQDAALLQVPPEEKLADWLLCDLPLPAGYVGAIACRGQSLQLQGFQLKS